MSEENDRGFYAQLQILRNPLFTATDGLARKYLSNIKRFQADPGVYSHHEIPPRGQYGGYIITKTGNLNPLYELPSNLTYWDIASQWACALTSTEKPPENGWFIGAVPIQESNAEDVYSHTREMTYWLDYFRRNNAFPNADIIRMGSMVNLHDLGEAVKGDHPVLKGKKTDTQEQIETHDFKNIILQELATGMISLEHAQQCFDIYDEFRMNTSREAQIVHILDRFCGNLVHLHSELNLNIKHLEISHRRLYEKYTTFAENAPDNYDPRYWMNTMMQYFAPSSNWIRFATKSDQLLKPYTMEY